MKPLEMDPYILDTLMPDLVGHDRHPSAFLVFLYLWRESHSGRVTVSLGQIAESTGICKRSVQSAVGRLVKRGLLSVRREGVTAVPEYFVHQPWRRTSSHSMRG